MKVLLRTLVAVSVVWGSQVAHAAPIVFDLEATAPGFHPVLNLTDPSGLYSISISRVGGFEVVDLSPFGAPAGYGSATLSPFNDPFTPTPFRIDVTAVAPGMAIESISWDVGDFGGDIDFMEVETFFQDGSSFASDGNLIPGGGVFDSIVFGSVPGSQSRGGVIAAEFTGGSPAFPQSLFYDNITIFSVASADLPMGEVGGTGADLSDSTGGAGGIPGVDLPEPAALLLGAVVAAAFFLRRRA